MKSQASKSQLSQFGEFSVAAELNRRGHSATVTYGNMKNTDVVAFSEKGHYAIVEVKTSSSNKFLTGLHPEKITIRNDNVFWVLVSTKQTKEPSDTKYYVLTDAEIKKIQADNDAIYLKAYLERNGKESTARGVPGFHKEKVEHFENCWDKIDAFLENDLS